MAAAGFVGGALLGAVFGELFKVVEEVASKAADFKPVLGRLRSTLNQITPIIEDIERLNRILDRDPYETDMFTDRLKEGQKLVLKCARVKWWKFWAKPFYAKKLLDLERSLQRFFMIDVTAAISRDSKSILVKVNSLDSKMGRIATTGGGFVGCCGVPRMREFVVGLDDPLRELKTMVVSGREQVVVVSALGGCGKTTLAKMLCHDSEIKGMFEDNIFFVTASKAPNLKVLIEKLFQHKGGPVPEFQTDEEAIFQLELMLKQIGPHPMLLVLDDVWFGLESLIQRLARQIPELKILVTSRLVFTRFESTYKLKLLKDQDAMALFCHAAFPQAVNSSIPGDILNKIVGYCRGCPLVLEVVGGSLHGKPKEFWKRTLKQLSEGQSIFSSECNNEVLMCLQPSLNSLDDRDKECYLDLASFPEDQRIPATALIDMWVGLYDLDKDWEAINILHELSVRSLVEQVITRKDASEISGYYNEHFAMQHDLLRELAIHQSSQEDIDQRERLIVDIKGNDLPRWWIEQGQHPIRARLVSISTDERFSSNWHNMQLPKVEVLVLNLQARNYALPQFLEKMGELKALIITNYGFLSAQINNFPLHGHLSSLQRIRLERISISSISNSILQLRNLRKISLIMCEVAEAFQNCTIEIPYILPNLEEIVIDYCYDLVEFPAWLCDIRWLKELSITNCHELVAIPEGFGKLENLEMLRLHACTKLLELPELIGSLQKLAFLDLSDCISMSKLPGHMGDLCGLRELHMRGCRGLSELPFSVKDLDLLEHVKCDEETAYLWEHYKIYLSNLEVHVVKEEVNLDWLHDFQP